MGNLHIASHGAPPLYGAGPVTVWNDVLQTYGNWWAYVLAHQSSDQFLLLATCLAWIPLGLLGVILNVGWVIGEGLSFGRVSAAAVHASRGGTRSMTPIVGWALLPISLVLAELLGHVGH